MYQVGFNVAIQHLRMRKRRPQHETFQVQHAQRVEPVMGPSDLDVKQMELDNAIRRLNPVDAAIILLYLEDKSQIEIGEIMGITPNHVGVKVSRIKSKLKKIVNISDNE